MAKEHHDGSSDDIPKTPTTPIAPSRIKDPMISPRGDTPASQPPKASDNNGKLKHPSNQSDIGDEEADDDGDEGESAVDEGQDDEPKLKYQRLTASLSPVYRNGDATSSFLVGGDKMILGTHNGNIVVLTLPAFQTLRVYHAHSASITSVSASPFPLSFPNSKSDQPRPSVSLEGPASTPVRESAESKATAPPRTPRQPPVPAIPSNSIYIATSSIDGHVCVASLIDPKDVTLRNFARPISSVALSPDYKNDRAYISGGLAGNLILTTGGKPGVSANANTNSAAAAASGWLSSIGLGSNSGTDRVLHSGEGSISTVKWSLSGKFVVWVNEHGVKIMRTNTKLESSDSELAWTRMGHIDRPTRSNWDVMAPVWKARAEWIDDASLEVDDDEPPASDRRQVGTPVNPALSALHSARNAPSVSKRKKIEKLVVGWGDTVWVVHVKPEHHFIGKDNHTQKSGGSATIVHHLLFDDCIVSGISLYTPSLLLILAYRTRDDNDNPLPVTTTTTPRRGVHHRQTGLSPELRLIDVNTKEEVDVDTLTMSRYESLSAADYHLSTLRIPTAPAASAAQRSAFEALGGGLWDVSVNATRIFSSAASIRSGTGSGDNAIGSPAPRLPSISKSSPARRNVAESVSTVSTPGLKIFMHSPYDCVLALKRDLSDHLGWLLERRKYKDAWELVCEHPEVVSVTGDDVFAEEGPRTPNGKGQSLADFFADDSASQTTASMSKSHKRAVELESQRIGDLWLQQLASAGEWATAGQVAGRVLGASPRWEHWVWEFAQAGRFNEITPYIPTTPMRPRIPSIVFERILGHYIMHDRLRFKDLIESWDPELFDVENVTSAIEANLSNGDIREDSVEDSIQGRDWRILLDALAKLKVADGRPKEALRCYIKLQNADAAMNLISEYHLVDAISDDIPGFLTLRVSKDQVESADITELEESTSEATKMLVDESVNGAIKPDIIVQQLQIRKLAFRPFLFLYFKALWNGQQVESRSLRIHQQLEYGGRGIVEEFGDLAVSLFADYDRTTLMDFLKQSRSYAYEQATTICERKQYFEELVYLLSQTGQIKRALTLIINSLGDVKFAINFAKEQEDADLWDDLVEFSMDKPRFIKGLLEEVGTAIDPIKLVRRIPEGLEIEGLRDGIRRMVREYEIQGSISEGVARVLRSEVAKGMEALRSGRAKGIKFDIIHESAKLPVDKQEQSDKPKIDNAKAPEDKEEQDNMSKPGHCVDCRQIFHENEKDILIGFACGHVYHLACIISRLDDPAAVSTAERLQSQLISEDDQSDTRSVGAKMAHAHLIKNIVGKGCPRCNTLVE